MSENIRVRDHCYVFELGVNKGKAADLNPDKMVKLLDWAHYHCPHGAHLDANFVADDGGVVGQGWFKADPQKNADCS